jgi:hypothetical protein
VNGSPANPGPGNRVTIDGLNLISVSGGQLVFASGRNGYSDPILKEPAFTRVKNLVLQLDITLPDDAHHCRVGWWNGIGNPDSDAILHFGPSGSMDFRVNSVNVQTFSYKYAAGTYQIRIALLTLGTVFYIKGGAWADWTKLCIIPIGSTASLYPSFINYSETNLLFDNVLVYVYDRNQSQYMLGAKIDGWTKSAAPVLPRRIGKWDENTTREIGIVIDENGNKVVTGGKITSYYWGCLTQNGGTPGIGRATSSDNGLTWDDRSDTPMIAPGSGGAWYATSIMQSSTIKRSSDGLLMMLATGSGGIGLLTSVDDGATWVDGGAKFSDANIAASGYTGSTAPACIKRSVQGDYICLYEAFHATLGWGIFGATSPDFVGTWTVMNGGQPLMARSGVTSGPLFWKQAGVSNPHPVEITPGNFLVAYSGFTTPGMRSIGFATTQDFINWSDYVDNNVMQYTPGGWDSSSIESSFLDKDSYPSLVLYFHGFETGFTTIELGRATTTG